MSPHPTHGLTCKEFAEVMMAYVEREMSETQRALFDLHLVNCPPCVDYLDSYRETIRLGQLCGSEDDAALPDDVPEELIKAILAVRKQQPED